MVVCSVWEPDSARIRLDRDSATFGEGWLNGLRDRGPLHKTNIGTSTGRCTLKLAPRGRAHEAFRRAACPCCDIFVVNARQARMLAA